MFTGLIETTSKVSKLISNKKGKDSFALTIAVKAPKNFSCKLGDSIAIDGCCLTLVKKNKDLVFEASHETLSLTTLSRLKVGSVVNLERALQVGSRLGGHFVAGHVDGTAEVEANGMSEGDWNLFLLMKHSLAKQCILKGSITVNGVSLTINGIVDHKKSSLVRLTLIPETLKRTNLQFLKSGSKVNIETDILAKFVARSQSFK